MLFETVSHSVVLVGLELTPQTKLALSSQTRTCLLPPERWD